MFLELVAILILVGFLVGSTVLANKITKSTYLNRGLRRHFLHPKRFIRFIVTWIGILLGFLIALPFFFKLIPQGKSLYETCRETLPTDPSIERLHRGDCRDLEGDPYKKNKY